MIKLLVAGDYAPHARISTLIEDNKYGEIFDEIKKYTAEADYSIVNLEAPIVVNESQPIKKTGPNLKCSPKSIDAIKYAGFNMVTLANNHIYDQEEAGMRDTLQILAEKDMDFVGAGMNITEATQIFHKEIKGKIIAFINFCENEWTIATEKTGGASPLDIIENYNQIIEARNNSDYVIVIIHGGHEYYQLPSPRMKKTYRFFIEAGADIVVNHHQHCYSGYERYKKGLIFYGIGNFCFDWAGKRNNIWNEGYMINFLLEDEIIDFDLIPYAQCDEFPTIELLKEDKEFRISIDKLNSIIANDRQLEEEYQKFILKKRKGVLALLEPYSNRYLRALRKRGWMFSFLNKTKKRLILNAIRCESHKDILLKALNI